MVVTASVDDRAACGVDEMPEAAELHDRDVFGKPQGGVEQRRDDLCPLALVSPDSPADEGFRSGPGGGFSAVSRGVADDPALPIT